MSDKMARTEYLALLNSSYSEHFSLLRHELMISTTLNTTMQIMHIQNDGSDIAVAPIAESVCVRTEARALPALVQQCGSVSKGIARLPLVRVAFTVPTDTPK
jgi:hypothetical protein